MTVAHRTAYVGDDISECQFCGEDWWDAQDDPPMFTRIWQPTDGRPTTRLTQSVWGIQCNYCGEYYAQINLYYGSDMRSE